MAFFPGILEVGIEAGGLFIKGASAAVGKCSRGISWSLVREHPNLHLIEFLSLK